MAEIKGLSEGLEQVKRELREITNTLDPFAKAAQDARLSLNNIQRAQAGLLDLHQREAFRSEPVARILSDTRLIVNSFSGYIHENEQLTNSLKQASAEVQKYTNNLSTAGLIVSNYIYAAHAAGQAYEPQKFQVYEPPSLQPIEKPAPNSNVNENLLEDLLQEVDPILVEKRRGAWEAFYSTSSDRLSQATHSMREVIRLFLDNLAPEEKIKATSWYKPDKSAKSGITRKHRIRFALGGEGGVCSENILVMGTTLYGELSNEAHSSNEPDVRREQNAQIFLNFTDNFLWLILVSRQRDET